MDGKPPVDDINFTLPDIYNERIEMFTDRQIYAVGEKILFKALNVSNPELLEACWSKVLYQS